MSDVFPGRITKTLHRYIPLSAGIFLRLRDDPREGFSPHPAGDALLQRRDCGAVGKRARKRSGDGFCEDSRGIGIPEGNPHRPGRENDQEDRTDCQGRSGEIIRESCFPGTARDRGQELEQRSAEPQTAGLLNEKNQFAHHKLVFFLGGKSLCSYLDL